jgi:WD40 repeat protein
MEAGRLVRQFRGHQDRISDIAISEDGRWLLSASLDGTLRVWDIPSARTLQVSPAITCPIPENPSAKVHMLMFYHDLPCCTHVFWMQERVQVRIWACVPVCA